MSKSFSQMETFLNLLNAFFNDSERVGKAPARFIHYTSLSAFNAMVSDYAEHGKRYIKLFPSHCRYLNDSREYIEGLEVVSNNKKVKENIAQQGNKLIDSVMFDDEIYTVSFCGKSDLLSQWKYYGKNSGVAMDFDFVRKDRNRCLMNWFKKNLPDKTESKDDDDIDALRGEQHFLSRPLKVFYLNHKNQFKKFIEVSNQYSDIPPLTIASLFIPFCKHRSFSEETESRLIFSPIFDEERALTTDIKYWAKEDKIVPQFECKVFYRDDDVELKKPIPLNNVMIGPGQNQTVVFNSVIHMLQKEKSNIRFIDFKSSETAKIESIKSDTLSNRIVQLNNSVVPINERLLNVEYRGGKKYLTFVTDVGITVQMSSTPFRP